MMYYHFVYYRIGFAKAFLIKFAFIFTTDMAHYFFFLYNSLPFFGAMDDVDCQELVTCCPLQFCELVGINFIPILPEVFVKFTSK